ncbi:death effector domain-containing protein [Caerostris extrusa]|uniref:Death effector domain-containing protein n=1 Tax=Caerostris extrusa TaxID=172846 RepID=A0AAV4MF25_CAEEX|nr:death effector domain-containing protein [Caerostris extrusa]
MVRPFYEWGHVTFIYDRYIASQLAPVLFAAITLDPVEEYLKNISQVPQNKHTCDVRLRVRAEYCNYQSVLQGNVSSLKADPIERQLECFSQASAILRARDLGYIVCDIKFSEITYLDAFWRDYLNGSLLEALKPLFVLENNCSGMRFHVKDVFSEKKRLFSFLSVEYHY